ncbi:uncharacterized protein PFL1_03740 [Pseudozyma flocculosa PF-1]|uniref:Related to 2-epi-5-epi-valiolone synthase n=2 Tax=Pseudozyma flocculosa TaxID=84751 RepID=A0A5C3F5U3_9BASI|nr:uncharacterized protein PFL1_03740 [Pseudozyma flocculosa PF-1]EPQ28940.1 hypothetical protein PFL1_03740 [Pseudozyma flocculosa PF-1]SPO38571.1 related to 2-epi-5-epi-valiolone synthase [Pseudozyma flocculosa]
MACCGGAASSDMNAIVSEVPATRNATGPGYHVKGKEDLNYTYSFVDNVFDQQKEDLATYFQKWGRVLVILDENLNELYGSAINAYFGSHNIKPTLHVFKGGELHKTMDTMLSFVDAMDSFGLIRKEPVLVVGGGLASDVVGYACASYRRSTNYVRVGTTLIALIDAAISIKVGINHKKLKNRLGAYHAPMHTFLDFDFLKTLPIGQTRNGTAELVKILHCADPHTWKMLVKYGEDLVNTAYGRNATGPGAKELKEAADTICRNAIKLMLDLESPNLHEIGLDRIIANGHGISPTLELAPFPPLRHGHAVCTDMAYCVTLAHHRGLISAEERDEWFGLAGRIGLTVDHPMLTPELLLEANEAIKKTRDGLQRFVVPKTMGKCVFLNDISDEEFVKVLDIHKSYVQQIGRGNGVGLDAYADAGDLGADPEQLLKEKKREAAAIQQKKDVPNGKAVNLAAGVPQSAQAVAA